MWDDARIQDVFTEQVDVSAASAHVDLHADIQASEVLKAFVRVEYGLSRAKLHAERLVTLSPGMNRITFPTTRKYVEDILTQREKYRERLAENRWYKEFASENPAVTVTP